MHVQYFKPRKYYLHPVSFIISIYLLLLVINVPVYHATDADQKYYSECSNITTFKCGNTTLGPIYYPFWGKSIRPLYCGLEGFELSCDNEIPVIDVGSGNKYRVKVIDTHPSFIVLDRYADQWKDTCAPKFNSANLNKKLFEYSPGTEYLYVFYNCSHELHVPVINGIPNSFTCGSRDKCTQVIFGVESHLNGSFERLWKSCNPSIAVPVNWPTELEKFFKEPKKLLEELLKLSFVVRYKINETACSNCRDSKGECWNATESGVNPKCLYKPGKLQDLRLKIGKAGGIAVISLLFLILLIFICYRRMKTRHKSSSYPKDVEAFIRKNGSSYPKDVEAFIRKNGSSIPNRFRYATLKTITNSFKDELGKGGYGNVYKGSLSDGRVVAVKVLNAIKGNGEEFINEVASIGRTSHVNIVTLLGYVYEGRKRALIYEFMPNGSLEKFIYGTTPSVKKQYLSWEKLHSIAFGIARGLEYLHCGCSTQILHFDIKPHNILLDKDFFPKISDFGLAKLYSREESILSSIMQARGTIGYIAPEVSSRIFGQVSHKSDVYSYGMMLLEMVGGRKNADTRAARSSAIFFPGWAYKHIEDIDETSFNHNLTVEEKDIVRKMMIVGLWCIQTNPSERPSISEVIKMFEGNSEALEIPPKPYMCSPPTSTSNSQQRLSPDLFCEAFYE